MSARVRETVVVPLARGAEAEADLWLELFEGEPHGLGRALNEAGRERPPELVGS